MASCHQQIEWTVCNYAFDKKGMTTKDGKVLNFIILLLRSSVLDDFQGCFWPIIASHVSTQANLALRPGNHAKTSNNLLPYYWILILSVCRLLFLKGDFLRRKYSSQYFYLYFCWVFTVLFTYIFIFNLWRFWFYIITK